MTDAELQQRVLAGVAAEVELFGSASESSSVLRREGLIASKSPATPDRSLFNSVYATDPEVLSDNLDELARLYAEAGVRAWLVWLPGGDPLGPDLLEPRGHAYDGAPRSMALELTELLPPTRELPAGVTLLGGDIREVAAINDRAYGHGPGAWAAALTRPPSIPIHWAVAVAGGEPIAGAAVIDVGDDALVTAVGTVPEHKGRGLAGHLVHSLLREAESRGARTGSLQASKAGAPIYERLGFRDVGWTDLWELRVE